MFRRNRRRLALCATYLALWLAHVPAHAQDAPTAPPPLAPATPAAPLVDASPPAPAPSAAASPAGAQLEAARAATTQLLELERRVQQLELERARIRMIGVRIGKIVSWTGTALFLSSAFSAYGRAEQVQEALKDERDDEYYDVNRDGDVDRRDEKRSRRVARTLAIGSLVPIGLGLFTTLLERSRRAQRRAIDYQLQDLAVRRRSLITRLDAQLAAARGQAVLQLRVDF